MAIKCALQGQLSGRGLRIAVVASRFNDAITDRLVAGALDALARHGLVDDDVTLVRVPGTFEIPVVARALATSGEYDGLVALGCLIRGETSHFDVLAAEVTGRLGSLMIESGVPVAFGVLTCENLEQAQHRSGGKGSNKGSDAAVTAIEMCNLVRELKVKRGRDRSGSGPEPS